MNYINKPDNNVHDIEELNYHNDFIMITDILKGWKKQKPSNIALKEVIRSMTHIGIYVMNMQRRQRQYDEQISKWRESNNKLKLKLREYEYNHETNNA